MTPTQQLINKKPKEFSRKTGCPAGTARNYSSGIGGLHKWVLDIVRFALMKGYNIGIVEEIRKDYALDHKPRDYRKKLEGIFIDPSSFLRFSCPTCRPNGEITDSFCETCHGSGFVEVYAENKNIKGEVE